MRTFLLLSLLLAISCKEKNNSTQSDKNITKKDVPERISSTEKQNMPEIDSCLYGRFYYTEYLSELRQHNSIKPALNDLKLFAFITIEKGSDYAKVRYPYEMDYVPLYFDRQGDNLIFGEFGKLLSCNIDTMIIETFDNPRICKYKRINQETNLRIQEYTANLWFNGIYSVYDSLNNLMNDSLVFTASGRLINSEYDSYYVGIEEDNRDILGLRYKTDNNKSKIKYFLIEYRDDGFDCYNVVEPEVMVEPFVKTDFAFRLVKNTP